MKESKSKRGTEWMKVGLLSPLTWGSLLFTVHCAVQVGGRVRGWVWIPPQGAWDAQKCGPCAVGVCVVNDEGSALFPLVPTLLIHAPGLACAFWGCDFVMFQAHAMMRKGSAHSPLNPSYWIHIRRGPFSASLGTLSLLGYNIEVREVFFKIWK